MVAVGSWLVWHNQAVHLLPQFFIANALLVAERVGQQALWRTASLHAQLLCMVAELGWTAAHPSPLPLRVAAAGLLGAALLNALQLCAQTCPPFPPYGFLLFGWLSGHVHYMYA